MRDVAHIGQMQMLDKQGGVIIKHTVGSYNCGEVIKGYLQGDIFGFNRVLTNLKKHGSI